jgi:hypothetical protein
MLVDGKRQRGRREYRGTKENRGEKLESGLDASLRVDPSRPSVDRTIRHDSGKRRLGNSRAGFVNEHSGTYYELPLKVPRAISKTFRSD